VKTHRTTIAGPAIILCLSWLFGLLLAMGTTGCIIIPSPFTDTNYARTNLNKLTLEQFVPAKTTVEEVVLALGEPDAVSADEHKLAYRSQRVVAFFFIYPVAASESEIEQERLYVFEFDSQGRLMKATQQGQFSLPELNLDKDNTNCVPVSIAGERLWRSCPHSFWFAGVNGYRDDEAFTRSGTPGRLLLTESNLYFFSNLRFANAEPTVKVPLSSVIEARVDKCAFGQRLVVRFKPDGVESFEIAKTGGLWRDKAAMRSACEFIQSKTGPAPTAH
jgi:hypothetical protein